MNWELLVARPLDDNVRRADALGQVGAHRLEPGVVAAGDDELGKRGRSQGGERHHGLGERTPATEHGNGRQRRSEEVGWELRLVAPDGDEEAHDPFGVGQVGGPQGLDLLDEARQASSLRPASATAGSSTVSERVASGRPAAAYSTPSPP